MTIKQERAAKLIQEILSELLMTEVTDPALLNLTIIEVEIDRELEYADVYVHSMDDQDEVMQGLERANSFLRRALATRTSFRKAPVLHFHWDASFDRGEHIDSLLAKLDIPKDESAPATPAAPATPPEEDSDSDDAGME